MVRYFTGSGCDVGWGKAPTSSEKEHLTGPASFELVSIPVQAVPFSGESQHEDQLRDWSGEGEVGRLLTPSWGLNGRREAERIEVSSTRPYGYGGWGLVYHKSR